MGVLFRVLFNSFQTPIEANPLDTAWANFVGYLSRAISGLPMDWPSTTKPLAFMLCRNVLTPCENTQQATHTSQVQA